MFYHGVVEGIILKYNDREQNRSGFILGKNYRTVIPQYTTYVLHSYAKALIIHDINFWDSGIKHEENLII